MNVCAMCTRNTLPEADVVLAPSAAYRTRAEPR